jgi:hypothetical protein
MMGRCIDRAFVAGAFVAAVWAIPACGLIIGDRATLVVPDEASSGSPDARGEPSSEAGPGTDGAPAPTAIESSHLQLWLSADVGVECNGGRVVLWADRAPHHRDAAARFGQLPPQCGVHHLNQVDVPYFSAPKTAQPPNIIDETLDVDLSFLAGSYYTIFVVERRWTDYPDGSNHSNFVLGTTATDETKIAACGSVDNFALQLGYTYYNGWPSFVLDQGCNGLGAQVDHVPSPPPAQATIDSARLRLTDHAAWQNGALVQTRGNGQALYYASGGAIGRALVAQVSSGTDGRFQGDVAEIVAYDTALSDDERATLEGYLHTRWSL